MNTGRKALLAFFALVVVLGATVVIRTLLHRPAALTAVAPSTITLDENLIARHLSEAVRFQTISFQDSAAKNGSAAQTTAFDAFIDWVIRTYPEVNAALTLQRIGGHTLLYRWQGSDPDLQPILLTGHYDVVPVIPGSESQWQHPPFAGVIDQGIIWGRGTLDDKGAVIAQLEAVTHLLKSGFSPRRTLYLSFGHDEEIGGRNGAAKVTQYLRQQGVQLHWSLDEGSFLFDGMLPGIEPLLAAINVAEKGSLTLQIVAKSAGGHSSMPPQQTAVGLLAEAISTLESNPVPGGLTGLSAQMFDTASRHMPFSSRLFFANRWLFGGLVENQLSAVTFGNAMLRTTTAPTMLSGSVKSNVLPIEAIATVNFRLHPRDTVDSLIAYVESLVASEHVEVRVPPNGGRDASAVSSWDSDGYRIVERALGETFGEVVVTPGLMIAASDSRHYGQVADNAFRFNPFTVTPEDMTGFHGTNEKISVATLAQGTRTYARIITLGAGQPL